MTELAPEVIKAAKDAFHNFPMGGMPNEKRGLKVEGRCVGAMPPKAWKRQRLVGKWREVER